jgi:hypothetical protein
LLRLLVHPLCMLVRSQFLVTLFGLLLGSFARPLCLSQQPANGLFTNIYTVVVEQIVRHFLEVRSRPILKVKL